MAVQPNEYERVRAWVLVKAESPQEVAERLYAKYGKAGGNDWVVVRTDVVDYPCDDVECPHNIIIPVDTANEDRLCEVVDLIRGFEGIDAAVVARVKKHFPYPPQDGSGFITERENELADEKVPDDEVGRQGGSPGPNPFG